MERTGQNSISVRSKTFREAGRHRVLYIFTKPRRAASQACIRVVASRMYIIHNEPDKVANSLYITLRRQDTAAPNRLRTNVRISRSKCNAITPTREDVHGDQFRSAHAKFHDFRILLHYTMLSFHFLPNDADDKPNNDAMRMNPRVVLGPSYPV